MQQSAGKKKKRTTMNTLTFQFKNVILLRFIVFALGCLAVLPNAQAVSPPPDGGYPNQNTAEGDNALLNLSSGANNTALGFQALLNNTTGSNNTATGANALFSNMTGDVNTATGFRALQRNTTGTHNTATGVRALGGNTTGNGNTAFGIGTLSSNTTGSFNIAVGFDAGANLTTGEHNIVIGNLGVAGESNTMRIGNVHEVATFIAGISGATVTGAPVVVNAAGQLGVAPTSARFKDEVKPMDKRSEAILALKPVTFRYKKEIDAERTPRFGLIAEDVAKVNPDLVVRDDSGEIFTVRYDAVNAMLLNEFLKEHKAFVEEQHKVEKLEGTVTNLVAIVKEQAAQIQKVSAQLEVSKPAPQVVESD
jgi:hypothetical protein